MCDMGDGQSSSKMLSNSLDEDIDVHTKDYSTNSLFGVTDFFSFGGAFSDIATNLGIPT